MRLNIGSTLFFDPPPKLLEVLAEELLLESEDLSDMLLAILRSVSKAGLAGDVEDELAGMGSPRAIACLSGVSVGSSRVFRLADMAAMSVVTESLRVVERREAERSRVRFSGFMMIWIWRLRGFLELDGGGLTIT